MLNITPSVASANQLYLAEEMSSFSKDTVLHVDIEDGNYVSNITFGLKTVKSLAEAFANELDFHLLCARPADYYAEISRLNTRYVIIPFEGLKEPMCELDEIRHYGMRPGMSFELYTPVNVIEAFKDDLKCVLLTTYGSPEGGTNGLGFKENSLERIAEVRKLMPDKTIIVDGGIDLNELRRCYEAGADTAVLGRLLFPEEISAENGLSRIILPKDRKLTPKELMDNILSEYNGVQP